MQQSTMIKPIISLNPLNPLTPNANGIIEQKYNIVYNPKYNSYMTMNSSTVNSSLSEEQGLPVKLEKINYYNMLVKSNLA
jgi:hypothetical protein